MALCRCLDVTAEFAQEKTHSYRAIWLYSINFNLSSQMFAADGEGFIVFVLAVADTSHPEKKSWGYSVGNV